MIKVTCGQCGEAFEARYGYDMAHVCKERPTAPIDYEAQLAEAEEIIEFLRHGEFYLTDEEVAGITNEEYCAKASIMCARARAWLSGRGGKK